MSVTGIVAALTAEARTLGAVPAPRATDMPGIHTLPNGNLLIVSGMGPHAAARAAAALIGAGANALLSFGLAGGLDPALRAGAVVVADGVLGAGGVRTAYPPWRERLAARVGALRNDREVTAGTLLSVPQPLSGTAAKAQARARTGACAVDMESFAIADIAAQQGVNFAVVRVVVDRATDALPRSVINATGPYGAVNLPRLLAELLGAPADLPKLLRLAQRYRAALRSLQALGRLDLGAP